MGYTAFRDGNRDQMPKGQLGTGTATAQVKTGTEKCTEQIRLVTVVLNFKSPPTTTTPTLGFSPFYKSASGKKTSNRKSPK